MSPALAFATYAAGWRCLKASSSVPSQPPSTGPLPLSPPLIHRDLPCTNVEMNILEVIKFGGKMGESLFCVIYLWEQITEAELPFIQHRRVFNENNCFSLTEIPWTRLLTNNRNLYVTDLKAEVQGQGAIMFLGKALLWTSDCWFLAVYSQRRRV